MASTDELLNIAAFATGVTTIGPGLRSVVWVQGCPFHCAGCISPDWIPIKNNILVDPKELAEELLENPEISGITISGGEPMLQAMNLAKLIHHARSIRDIDVISFTGFEIEKLRQESMLLRVQDFLSQIDVLIDGKYIQELNDNQGLRGSSNQRIHYLSDRLRNFDFEGCTRQVEVRVQNGQVLFVGVPPDGILPHLIKKIDSNMNLNLQRMSEYERA
jgi:anaerobic ribonucleoside-triphosphate reductase activating protein